MWKGTARRFGYMEESAKLEKIKKSCETGEKVTKVLFIITMVIAVICIAAGIVIFTMGKRFNDWVEQQRIMDYFSAENTIGKVSFIQFGIPDPSSIKSDIPVIIDALLDHPYTLICGFICMTAGVIVIIASLLIRMIGSTFKLIRTEENPFTDKAIRKIITVMIILSTLILFTTGSIFGIVGYVVTWVFSTILDYAKTLQVQSDETL